MIKLNELIKKYNALHNQKDVPRKKLSDLADLAFAPAVYYDEKIAGEIHSKLTHLLNNDDEDYFNITLSKKYTLTSQLNAARHEGIAKEGLDDCGRLNKGHQYKKGKIVKTEIKLDKRIGLPIDFLKKLAPKIKTKLDKGTWLYNQKSISFLEDKDEEKIRLILIDRSNFKFEKKSYPKSTIISVLKRAFYLKYGITIDNYVLSIKGNVKKPKNLNTQLGLFGLFDSTNLKNDLKGKTKKEIIREIKKSFNRFKNIDFKHKDIKETITITKLATGKVIYGRSEKNSPIDSILGTAILNLPLLIIKSKLVNTVNENDLKDNHKKHNADKLYNLISKVNIDGKEHNFVITLLRIKGNSVKYFIEEKQIKKATSSSYRTLSGAYPQKISTARQDKDTKKTNTPKKKTLNTPITLLKGFTKATETPVKLSENVFRLDGEIGKLLGELQRYRLAIQLIGDPHAGKTEFLQQLTNEFANKFKRIAYLDLEQGGLVSKETRNGFDRNITKENQNKIFVKGEAENGLELIDTIANDVDLIVVDSFQELEEPVTKFNELRKKHPNTIFIFIFQQNGKGSARGGVKSKYDAPVIIKVHKVDDTFVNNYAEITKNRGNKIGLKYNVSQKKLVNDEDSEKDISAKNSTLEPVINYELID